MMKASRLRSVGATAAMATCAACSAPAPTSEVNEPEPAPAAAAPLPTEDEIAAAIASSDDFARHRDGLIRASRELISTGRCTLDQLADWGWTRSVNRPGQSYFTYCGEAHVSDRIYVDLASGTVSQ